MKKAFRHLTIAAGIVALITSMGVSFQREERSSTRELEGSWIVQVTPEFPLPYEALVSYGAGRTLIETKFYLTEFVSTVMASGPSQG